MVRALCFALLLLSSAAQADAKVQGPTYGIRYEVPTTGTGERVLVLPQDEDKFYLTVFGNPDDSRFQRTVEFFDSHNGLKGIKEQVHFNVIETTSTMFRERYAKKVPSDMPVVRLQSASGVIIYERDGAHVPLTADLLYTEIDGECLRRWNCPCPCPRPQPQPAPAPSPAPAPPSPSPAPQPPSDLPPWWMALSSLALGLAGGIGYQYKKTYYAEAAAA